MRRNPRNKKHKNKFNSRLNFQKNVKNLSIFIGILAIVLIAITIYYYIQNNNKTEQAIIQSKEKIENEELQNGEKNKTETDTTFSMTAIGDVMCHNTQYMDAYIKETGKYDFTYVYEDIRSYIKTSDIAIGNLETTFAGADKGYSNYPTFNSPDDLAYGLKDLGLDVISTAGNHSLDTKFDGLSRTIDVLDKADISHVGTNKTQEEQNKVLFKYVKGIKIAFINYTYGTNGISIPKDKPFCVNVADENLIKQHIETAKSNNADMIVACMHWGTEYKLTPNSEQEKWADFLFKNGVNVILGTHPHVLQPMEKRTVTLDDGTTQDGFVIYSLGNFTADQNADNTRNSIILNLNITKHTDGKVTIDHANYIPIYMYKNPSLASHKMKLLDIENSISYYDKGIDTSIGKSLYNTLKIQLDKIKKVVGNTF